MKYLRSIRRLLTLGVVILSLFLGVFLLSFLCRESARREKRVARLLQVHLRIIGWVCGLKVLVRGPKPRVGGSFLLLSNHVSYWDIVALGGLFPLGFMAKDSIAGWPLLGRVIRLCNTVFVDRDNIRARWRALRTLQSRVCDLPYCVFPEGTTTAEVAPQLEQWRRGNVAVLREPGIDIWLAGLHYAGQQELAWVDDAELLPHLWKVLQAPGIDMMIHLQPFQPESGMILREVPRAAWRQTAELCLAARRDMGVLGASEELEASREMNSVLL